VPPPPKNCACKFPRTPLKPSTNAPHGTRRPPLPRRGGRAPCHARLGASPWPGFVTRSAATPRSPLGASLTPHGPMGSRGGPRASAAGLGPPSRYAPGADEPCRPGAAPDRVAPAVLSASPLESVGHGSLVTEDHREVSPLARGVMSRERSTPLRPATGRPSLAPDSSTRRPIGAPYGALSLPGGLRAYHVAPPKPAWVRPRLDAGGASSAPDEFGAPGPGHLPFWSQPISTLGLSWVTTLTAVHRG
jgi:hypothetical protein